MESGQIIATSHDLTPNGGLVREILLFQGNLGWWNIIIWPDGMSFQGFGTPWFTSRSCGSMVNALGSQMTLYLGSLWGRWLTGMVTSTDDTDGSGSYSWVVATQIFFYFHLYLGKWSSLTSIFFRWVETCWNHQVDRLFIYKWSSKVTMKLWHDNHEKKQVRSGVFMLYWSDSIDNSLVFPNPPNTLSVGVWTP